MATPLPKRPHLDRLILANSTLNTPTPVLTTPLPSSGESRHRAANQEAFASFHEQERMLADRPRMAFYAETIRRHIHPGDRVIDLGTGTGILAALASRRGAHVHALDHSSMLEHAKELAAANGIERVEFVSGHSSTFTLPEPVDVILHEQMGNCLFDEAMLPNILDLRDRLLKPGGRIVPARFEFFCEPVQVAERRHIPFIWNLKIEGFDYSSLEHQRSQDPGYYRLRTDDPTFIAHFLTAPAPALAFDLHTVNESTLSHELVSRRTVTEAGRIDAIAIYFTTLVDDDLRLTTAPQDPGHAPHWGYRLLRTEPATYAVGDIIETKLSAGRWHDLDSWRWSHRLCSPNEAQTP